MKKLLLLPLLLSISVMATAQTKIQLTVGSRSMTATLVDNEATRKLLSLLENGPFSINMSDYGGFEKVGQLPQSLPTSNSQITTQPGDIMLYQGNNMVIFYGSNSWSYTRLGKIEDATVSDLRQFLGEGNISLTLSLSAPSGVSVLPTATQPKEDAVYDLRGNLVGQRPLSPGLYIVNGKKTLIR